ncbi:MAG: hypothetical protein IPM77_13025 [Crocinitomicaceae bacterium]|nr:hypothetical protein [Crocinitomicaceae bacterium]
MSDVPQDIIYGEGVRLNSELTGDQKSNIFKLRSLEKTLAELQDPAFDRDAKIAIEKKSIFYRNVSRAGLLALWLGIAYLVYRAYKKRIKEGRFTS